MTAHWLRSIIQSYNLIVSRALVEKAQYQAFLLARATKTVFIIAIFIYLIIGAIAIINRAWILLLFVSCLLLGVWVIYLLIQASLTHFELIRSRD